MAHNKPAVVASCVITRQRPGTAKGLIFLTLEDETGHANAIVMPDVYSLDPMVVLHERFVRVKRAGAEPGWNCPFESGTHLAALGQRGSHAVARLSLTPGSIRLSWAIASSSHS